MSELLGRVPDPNRTRDGIDSPKIFINAEALLTFSCRPAWNHALIDSATAKAHDSHAAGGGNDAGALRLLGQPRQIELQQNRASSGAPIYVRSRPFSAFLARVLDQCAECVLFAPANLPAEVLDEALTLLGWTQFLRTQSSVGGSRNGAARFFAAAAATVADFDAFDGAHHKRTFRDLGVPSSQNMASRALIIDTCVDDWEPLLQRSVLVCPKQDEVFKGLPRYVEPLSLLATMTTAIDAVTTYGVSLQGHTMAQCLAHVELTRFAAWRVFVPAACNASIAERVRAITAAGGGRCVRRMADANIVLFVPTSSTVAAAAAAGGGDAAFGMLPSGALDDPQQQQNLPPPSQQCDVVMPAYFEASRALAVALPTVWFLAADAQAQHPHNRNSMGPEAERKFLEANASAASRLSGAAAAALHDMRYARSLVPWWEWMSTLSPIPRTAMPVRGVVNDRSSLLFQIQGAAADSLSLALGGSSNKKGRKHDVADENDGGINGSPQRSDEDDDDDDDDNNKDDEDSSSSSDDDSSAKKSSKQRPGGAAQNAVAAQPHFFPALYNAEYFAWDWVVSHERVTKEIRQGCLVAVAWVIARMLAPFSEASRWLPVATLNAILHAEKLEPNALLLAEVLDMDARDAAAALTMTTTTAATSGTGKNSGGGSATAQQQQLLLRPGSTHFIVARGAAAGGGGSFARASRSGNIEPIYAGSSNSVAARSAIRSNAAFFKDAATETGDGRSRVEMKSRFVQVSEGALLAQNELMTTAANSASQTRSSASMTSTATAAVADFGAPVTGPTRRERPEDATAQLNDATNGGGGVAAPSVGESGVGFRVMPRPPPPILPPVPAPVPVAPVTDGALAFMADGGVGGAPSQQQRLLREQWQVDEMAKIGVAEANLLNPALHRQLWGLEQQLIDTNTTESLRIADTLRQALQEAQRRVSQMGGGGYAPNPPMHQAGFGLILPSNFQLTLDGRPIALEELEMTQVFAFVQREIQRLGHVRHASGAPIVVNVRQCDALRSGRCPRGAACAFAHLKAPHNPPPF